MKWVVLGIAVVFAVLAVVLALVIIIYGDDGSEYTRQDRMRERGDSKRDQPTHKTRVSNDDSGQGRVDD